MTRLAIAVALGLVAGAAWYLATHLFLPVLLSSRTMEEMVGWLAVASPVSSLLLCGLVSGVIAGRRWLAASALCGIIAVVLFLWFFSATGYWFFFALAFVVGVFISLLGGLLGSRIPKHVPQ